MAKRAINYLIQESPMIVLPTLAASIGLNNAIFLQQVHFWLTVSPKEKDGKKWIYNTAKDWREQMPFWSVSTINRIIADLRDRGLLMTDNHNPQKYDRTLWYTIDYNQLDKIDCANLNKPNLSNCANPFCQNDKMSTDNNTDNTTDKKESITFTTDKTVAVLIKIDPSLESEICKKYHDLTPDLQQLFSTTQKIVGQFTAATVLEAWNVLRDDKWFVEHNQANVWYLFGKGLAESGKRIRALLDKKKSVQSLKPQKYISDTPEYKAEMEQRNARKQQTS